MEHFRRLDLAKLLKDKTTFPRDTPMYVTMGTGLLKNKQISSFCYGSWGEAVDGKPRKFPYYNLGCSAEQTVMCPQLILEPILKEHLEAAPNVTSYWGWQLEDLQQDTSENGVVTANVKNARDKRLIINARFVVGCDGGSSYTRKLIGVHTYGHFVLHKAVSVYFESQELKTILEGKPGVHLVSNCRISGIMVTVDLNKGRFLIYSLLPYSMASLAQSLLDNPKQFVNDFVGKEIESKVITNSSWETHAVLATKYREGRVFLSGDAAHQWVPVGGIGMNTGIADVMDLSWKIDAILKGWGGAYLLDSYLLERRPLADKTKSFVLDTGEIVGTALSRRLGPLLSCLPGVSALYGGYLVKAVTNNLQSGTNIVLGFQYSNSNIIVHQKDSSQHRDAINVLTPFLPRAIPGRRAPHVVLDNLPTIHDLFGRDHTLLIIDGSTTDCRDLQDEARERKMPLEVHKVKGSPEVVTIYSNCYYLVRPDGIIAWCSDFQPNRQDAGSIISVICGDRTPKCLPTQWVSRAARPTYKFQPVFEIACIGYLSFVLHHYTPLSLPFSYLLGLNAVEMLRLCLTIKKNNKMLAHVSRHKACLLRSYGSPATSLELEERHVNRNFGPTDVLVKVHAASVNRIDVGMTMGYGAKMVSANFKGASLPRVLGRDCAGEVVAVGEQVKKFMMGDLVYATCPWSRDGSHAQYVTIDEEFVSHKPRNLSYVEAASLPWVATTVWTALVTRGGLNSYNTANKKVLVHGGSGGVGSFAIQLLKAWGAEVVTTCSTENVPHVQKLGADTVIDYTKEDFATLKQDFDLVFDTVGFNYEVPSLRLLKRFHNAKYLSIRSPLLRLVNRWGVLIGSLVTQVITGLQAITQRLLHGRGFYYVIAQPNGECLDEVREMVEMGLINPQLSPVGTFPLEKISDAYEFVRQGHAGGKVIITFT